MKTLSLETMESLHGGQEGWHWTWKQHLGCALTGAALGGGIASVAVYAGCLLLES